LAIGAGSADATKTELVASVDGAGDEGRTGIDAIGCGAGGADTSAGIGPSVPACTGAVR
jgi:hypothetical protein